jgi:hypothetical protein
MIMAVAEMRINMPVTLVSAVAVGFCSVFGYCLIREMAMPPHVSDGNQPDGCPGFKRAGGVVLFLGVLLFGAALPWFFIGLRFPGQMVFASGVIVLLAAVSSVLLVPALAGLCRAASPTGVPEEEHP